MIACCAGCRRGDGTYDQLGSGAFATVRLLVLPGIPRALIGGRWLLVDRAQPPSPFAKAELKPNPTCLTSRQVYRVLVDDVQPAAAKVLLLSGDPRAQLYFLQVGSLSGGAVWCEMH